MHVDLQIKYGKHTDYNLYLLKQCSRGDDEKKKNVK